MKLLYCPHCQSVFNLIRNKIKFCDCNQSYGVYEDDGQQARCSKKAIPIGIVNKDLEEATIIKPTGDYLAIRAFMFPENHPRIKRI